MPFLWLHSFNCFWDVSKTPIPRPISISLHNFFPSLLPHLVFFFLGRVHQWWQRQMVISGLAVWLPPCQPATSSPLWWWWSTWLIGSLMLGLGVGLIDCWNGKCRTGGGFDQNGRFDQTQAGWVWLAGDPWGNGSRNSWWWGICACEAMTTISRWCWADQHWKGCCNDSCSIIKIIIIINEIERRGVRRDVVKIAVRWRYRDTQPSMSWSHEHHRWSHW